MPSVCFLIWPSGFQRRKVGLKVVTAAQPVNGTGRFEPSLLRSRAPSMYYTASSSSVRRSQAGPPAKSPVTPTVLPTSSRTLRRASCKRFKSWAGKHETSEPGPASSWWRGQRGTTLDRLDRPGTEGAFSWPLSVQRNRAQETNSTRDKGPATTGTAAWCPVSPESWRHWYNGAGKPLCIATESQKPHLLSYAGSRFSCPDHCFLLGNKQPHLETAPYRV